MEAYRAIAATGIGDAAFNVMVFAIQKTRAPASETAWSGFSRLWKRVWETRTVTYRC